MKKIIIAGGLLFILSNGAYAQTIRNPFLPRLPQEPAIKTPVQAQRPISRSATQPVTEPAAPVQLPDFTISGIIWNSERPQAIINDQVVGIGGTVNEMEIVAIERTAIIVSIQNQIFTIKPDFDK